MKMSLFKPTLFLLAGIGLLTSAAQAGSNLIVNSDFKDVKEGVPVGWISGPATEKETPPDAIYSFGKDPTDSKHRATVSVKYKSGDARAMWKGGIAKGDAEKKFKPGKKFEFSVWVRYELAEPPKPGQSPVHARCGIAGSDWEGIVMPVVTPTGSHDVMVDVNAANPPSDAPVAPVKPYVQKDIPQKSDWVQWKVVFEIPKDTRIIPANCIVYIAINAPGEVWADDFKLVEVPDTTPVTTE